MPKRTISGWAARAGEERRVGKATAEEPANRIAIVLPCSRMKQAPLPATKNACYADARNRRGPDHASHESPYSSDSLRCDEGSGVRISTAAIPLVGGGRQSSIRVG